MSAGERQQVCLARALLRNAAIAVLDEASSSISWEIDQALQEAISSQLQGCTRFIIAHRLSTVADCDRIMCLDKGSVQAYDSPAALLGMVPSEEERVRNEEEEQKKSQVQVEEGTVVAAGAAGTAASLQANAGDSCSDASTSSSPAFSLQSLASQLAAGADLRTLAAATAVHPLPNNLFARLVRETGPTTEGALRGMALEAWWKKRQN